jgi:hypothetical protein
LMTQRDEYRSLYLSYLKCCNEHDFDGMASFYTSTIKVNDVPAAPRYPCGLTFGYLTGHPIRLRSICNVFCRTAQRERGW